MKKFQNCLVKADTNLAGITRLRKSSFIKDKQFKKPYRKFFNIQTKQEQPRQKADTSQLQTSRPETAQNSPQQEGMPAAPQPKPKPVRVEKKVGRNEICPCGSGKKFKQCHGKLS